MRKRGFKKASKQKKHKRSNSSVLALLTGGEIITISAITENSERLALQQKEKAYQPVWSPQTKVPRVHDQDVSQLLRNINNKSYWGITDRSQEP